MPGLAPQPVAPARSAAVIARGLRMSRRSTDISIIIATHNAAQTLGRCLDSFLLCDSAMMLREIWRMILIIYTDQAIIPLLKKS